MRPTLGVCLYHSRDNILRFTGFLSWFSLAQAPKKEKARAASARFQKVLHKVLTEQALYINNLAEPQLLQLVSTPLDLISRLTEHAAVVAESWELGPVPGAQSFFFYLFSFLSFFFRSVCTPLSVSLSVSGSLSPPLLLPPSLPPPPPPSTALQGIFPLVTCFSVKERSKEFCCPEFLFKVLTVFRQWSKLYRSEFWVCKKRLYKSMCGIQTVVFQHSHMSGIVCVPFTCLGGSVGALVCLVFI